MKNVKFIFMSFIALAVLSCSEETIKQNGETALIKSTGSTKKPAGEDCSTKAMVVSEDNQYNCFGLAFLLSETEDKDKLENDEIYDQFITTGIFVEDNSSNASKVLYWNNEPDFIAKRVQGITHAAILTDGAGSTVYSKEGSIGLYKNCIEYYYLWEDKTTNTPPPPNHFYRKYALNLELNPHPNPIRTVPFTLSVAHDASALLEASYSWEIAAADANYLQIGGSGGSCTLKFSEFAPKKNYIITLKAKHQRGRIYNTISVPKELSKSITITLEGDPAPLPVALTATFTGSNYVTQSSVGSWTATISGGALPYQHFSWWIKRHQDPNSFYTQIATGNPIHLYTTTSSKPTYFDLYFRVVDANNQIFVTAPQLIQSTGPLELIDL